MSLPHDLALHERIEELEGELSRTVSARDLTIRDLRAVVDAAVKLLRDARSLIDTMNGNIQRQTSAEIRDHVSYAVCQDMIRRIDALERSVRVGADASPSPEPLRPIRGETTERKRT